MVTKTARSRKTAIEGPRSFPVPLFFFFSPSLFYPEAIEQVGVQDMDVLNSKSPKRGKGQRASSFLFFLPPLVLAGSIPQTVMNFDHLHSADLGCDHLAGKLGWCVKRRQASVRFFFLFLFLLFLARYLLANRLGRSAFPTPGWAAGLRIVLAGEDMGARSSAPFRSLAPPFFSLFSSLLFPFAFR